MRCSLPHPLLLAFSWLMFFPAGQAPAQDWLRQAITPDSRSHDFGTVARAANTEHRFEIKNVLDQDLHISSVRASCGCTTPIIETKTIRPGETGAILARFNTGTFTGARKATLTVSIDKPSYTELQLNVKGYIRSDVVFSPGEANFGQVAEGELQSLELTLDYAGRGDWAIERIESSLPFVDAKFEEVSREAGRIKYRINIALDGSAPAGYVQNQLVLQTNDRRLTAVPIRLIADIQPAIQVSPKNVALGNVKPGEPVEQRLVVRGKKPFRVLDISSDAAEVRFDPILDSKATHLINMILAPRASQVGGKISSQLILKTDLNDSPLKLGLSYDLETQSGFEKTVSQTIDVPASGDN